VDDSFNDGPSKYPSSGGKSGRYGQSHVPAIYVINLILEEASLVVALSAHDHIAAEQDCRRNTIGAKFGMDMRGELLG
jgi:hypothetical protein